MKRFFTLLSVEGKLTLRCPDVLIFGLGMPAGVLLLISVIAGGKIAGDSSMTFLQSGFASLLTVGICATAFMGLPLTFADYRDKKILKHFFVTPVSPMILLFVQVVIGILTSLVSAGVVTILAVLLFDYRMEGNVLLFIGGYFLVMFSMYGIGMIIASLCRTVKMANVATSLVYFPMLFLSGATIPFEVFPKAVQTVAAILPLTHGIKLLKNLSLGIYNTNCIFACIILLIFLIVGTLISVVSFKWE